MARRLNIGVNPSWQQKAAGETYRMLRGVNAPDRELRIPMKDLKDSLKRLAETGMRRADDMDRMGYNIGVLNRRLTDMGNAANKFAEVITRVLGPTGFMRSMPMEMIATGGTGGAGGGGGGGFGTIFGGLMGSSGGIRGMAPAAMVGYEMGGPLGAVGMLAGKALIGAGGGAGVGYGLSKLFGTDPWKSAGYGAIGGLTIGAGPMAALGIGAFAALSGVSLDFAVQEQAVEEQLAFRGSRLGNLFGKGGMNQFVLGGAFTRFGMDRTEAQNFMLNIANVRGMGRNQGDLRNFTTGAAEFSRMMGLTNEQGATITGQLGRVGFDTKQMERFGEIIGVAASRAGLQGREGEILKALTDNISNMTNFLSLNQQQATQYGINAANLYAAVSNNPFFKNIPGMQGQAGVATLETFFGTARQQNPFMPGNMTSSIMGLGALGAAKGDMGLAGAIMMSASMGGPLSRQFMAGGIGTIQNIFGADPKKMSTTQMLMEAAFSQQAFGHPLGGGNTPLEILQNNVTALFNLRQAAMAGGVSEDLLKRYGINAKAESMEDLTKSLTNEMASLSNEMANIGKKAFPAFGDIAKMLQSLGSWWESKGEKTFDRLADYIAKLVGPETPADKVNRLLSSSSGVTEPLSTFYGGTRIPSVNPAVTPGGGTPTYGVDDLISALTTLVNFLKAVYTTPAGTTGAPSGFTPKK